MPREKKHLTACRSDYAASEKATAARLALWSNLGQPRLFLAAVRALSNRLTPSLQLTASDCSAEDDKQVKISTGIYISDRLCCALYESDHDIPRNMMLFLT